MFRYHFVQIESTARVLKFSKRTACGNRTAHRFIQHKFCGDGWPRIIEAGKTTGKAFLFAGRQPIDLRQNISVGKDGALIFRAAPLIEKRYVSGCDDAPDGYYGAGWTFEANLRVQGTTRLDAVETLERAPWRNEAVGVPPTRIDLAEIVHGPGGAELRGRIICKPCLDHSFLRIGVELSLDPLHRYAVSQPSASPGRGPKQCGSAPRRRLPADATCYLNGRFHFATKCPSQVCADHWICHST